MSKRASPPPVPPAAPPVTHAHEKTQRIEVRPKAPAAPATPAHEKTQRLEARPKAPAANSGKVQFDERGQAVWAWAVRTGMFDRNASTQRIRALTDGPVKLELEQTLSDIKRSVGTRPAPAAPARPEKAEKPGRADIGFNPYEGTRLKSTPKESGGTDPYSRGGARKPESVTFNPYERKTPKKP